MITEPKTQAKNYREKMVDYKRFAFTLICASVFFYLGVLISSQGKGLNPNFLMMGTTVIFLILSGVFFSLSIKNKKLLNELNEMDEVDDM